MATVMIFDEDGNETYAPHTFGWLKLSQYRRLPIPDGVEMWEKPNGTYHVHLKSKGSLRLNRNAPSSPPRPQEPKRIST